MDTVLRSKIGVWALRAVECLTPLSFLLTLGVLVAYADRGFDVTDEGFYLLTAQYPSDVKACASISYEYLAVFFRTAGCSIVTLRVFAIVMTTASGVVLAAGVIRMLKSIGRSPSSVLQNTSAVSFVCLGALMYYAWGLRTPSYNFLNAFGLTMSAGLLLLALSTGTATQPRLWMAAGCLLGTGACAGLTFFAKFSTGIVLVSLYTFFLLVWPGDPETRSARKLKRIGLMWGGLALMVLAHFAAIQPFAEWWSVVSRGIRVTEALQAGHGLSAFARYLQELKALLQSPFHGFWPAFLLLPAGFAIAEIIRRRGWGGRIPPIAVILSVFLLAAFLSYLKGLHRGGCPFVCGTMTFYFIWLAILLCCLAFCAWCRREEVMQADRQSWRRMFLMAGMFVVLPFAGAVGTGNAITTGAIACMAPWFAALLLLLVLVSSVCHTRLIVVAGMAVVAMFACVQIATAYLSFPYRLNGGVLHQTVSTEIGIPPATLKLDPETSGFFKALRNSAEANGFKAGDDLLAFHAKPGIVFAMGGRSPGLQWYSGGYRGSRAACEMGLSLAPPERLKEAFILQGLNSAAAMPDLKRFGIRFPEDYRLCGHFVLPVTKETVVLWRPRGEEEANKIP